MSDARTMNDAMSWCLKNKIIVYPVVINNQTLKLEIDFKGTIITGTQVYKSKPKGKDLKWSDAIRAIYKGYYKRFHSPSSSD